MKIISAFLAGLIMGTVGISFAETFWEFQQNHVVPSQQLRLLQQQQQMQQQLQQLERKPC